MSKNNAKKQNHVLSLKELTLVCKGVICKTTNNNKIHIAIDDMLLCVLNLPVLKLLSKSIKPIKANKIT